MRFSLPFSQREILLFLLPLLILLLPVLVLQPTFLKWLRPQEKQRGDACFTLQRQIGLAMMAYQRDYDQRFPLIVVDASRPKKVVGWVDALTPYHFTNVFFCFQNPHPIQGNPNLPQFTDFWFNGQLSGQKRAAVAQPALTLCLGDGNDGTDNTNATYNLTAFPPDWLFDRDKPTFRHFGGANYAFVDGHVKWLKPDQAAHFGGRNDPFALK